MSKELPENLKIVLEQDQVLRKQIAEFYLSLEKLRMPAKAVELLAEHVAIMVEMINEFKQK